MSIESKGRLQSFLGFFKFKSKIEPKKKKPVTKIIFLTKRQKLVFGVFFLSIILFVLENFFTGYIFLISLIFAILTNIFLYWAIRDDLKETASYQVFILSFFYSLSFALFFSLVPARFLTRAITTTIYAIGLYSLFLSENIYIVGSIRTIALLNGARIVTFVISLLSYFFLTNIVFSLHFNVFFTIFAIFIFTFFFLFHALWTYTLDTKIISNLLLVSVLTLCIVELSLVLWFWPMNQTVIALFLTSIYYIFCGISHVYFDKRLFKNIIWEYVWIGAFAFFILILFTSWIG